MKPSIKNSTLQESSEEIKEQVRRLLRAAGVKDELPTPKEDIIATAKLVKIGRINLSEYEETWQRKGINFLKSALSKVKGLLDFREKIVYVSPEIHPAQKNFVTYHEITHRILPWHEILFNPHLDNDFSIDPRTSTGLECEANFGASLIQFQIDRFNKESKDLPLGLKSAKTLADRFQTSLHSTFRKYVEDSHRACALLILEMIEQKTPDNQPILQLWYPLQSEEFTAKFGLKDWEKFYFPGDYIYDTVFSNYIQLVNEGEIILKNLGGSDKKCRIETFDNNFNYFVLIYPVSFFSIHKNIILEG